MVRLGRAWRTHRRRVGQTASANRAIGEALRDPFRERAREDAGDFDAREPERDDASARAALRQPLGEGLLHLAGEPEPIVARVEAEECGVDPAQTHAQDAFQDSATASGELDMDSKSR